MKSRTDWLAFVLIAVMVGLFTLPASVKAQQQDDKTAWYNQEKIRFFWGQWNAFGANGVSDEEMMKNLSLVRGTVFVSLSATPTQAFKPEQAEFARKYAVRYFGVMYLSHARAHADRMKSRLAVNKRGLTSLEEKAKGMDFGENDPPYIPCPLDEQVIEQWAIVPAMDAAKSGLVDGCHIDFESYGALGFDQMGDNLCYCDDCWSKYQVKKGFSETVSRADRYQWLEKHDLLDDYLALLCDRLAEVFRGGVRRIHEVNPDFLFSAYQPFVPGNLRATWRFEGAALGMNSPHAPFFIIDPTHYYPNHTAPWWESYYTEYHKLGMKHILGTWSGGMFGESPYMDVSATQWMYDAAINHDGYWIWWEHNWGPNDYRAYRTADQRIRATENKVGDFLLSGEQDHGFVNLVEQSGDPELGGNILHRSYHLGDSHLVHVNNVNTDIPVTVLARISRVPADSQWTVTDPMNGLYYVPDPKKILWSSGDLKQGVLLSMEQRSEAWLLLSPAAGNIEINPAKTVYAGVIKAHPERPQTQGPLPAGTAQEARFPLFYIKSNPLGYYGPTINPVMGTSVHFIDADAGGSGAKRLFPPALGSKVSGGVRFWDSGGIMGNSWSPTLSSDGRLIVFCFYVNGKGQIYLINSDGSSPYNISNNDYCDNSPAWSPDGRKIAFVSNRDADWEIYVMNADGTDQRRLTDSPGSDRRPAWSPDGSRIAFESDRGGDFDIHVINADGSGERCLIHRAGNDYEPIWSPDGRNIACTANPSGRHRDVVVMNAETGASAHPLGLTHAAKTHWQFREMHSICFSPDGNKIAGVFGYSAPSNAQTGTFTVATDGSDLRILVAKEPLKPYPGGPAPSPATHQLTGGWYYNGSASRRWLPKTFANISWSPDGNRLAFSSDMDESGYSYFYTIDALVKVNLDWDFIADNSDYPTGSTGWSQSGTGKNTQWRKNAPGVLTIDRSDNPPNGSTAFVTSGPMGFTGPYVHGLMRVRHEIFPAKARTNMETHLSFRDAPSDTYFMICSVENEIILGHGVNRIPVKNDDRNYHDIEWELHLPTQKIWLYFDGKQIGGADGYQAISGLPGNSEIMWGDGIQTTRHKTDWDRVIIQEGRRTDEPPRASGLIRLDATLNPDGPYNNP